MASSKSSIRATLLAWYDAGARDLPWRVAPAARARGVTPDPYRVWLSEIMLQQTTTGHAAPYFEAFASRWPTVGDLAAAEDDALMAAWAGLGYYARARNLLACARTVEARHGGRFPADEAGLRALPGVGAYTAAAVAAIAFEAPANVVDGNVERVMARLFALETPLPTAKRPLTDLAAGFVSADRPGDWAQALMDLGATVCRPRAPACEACPWKADCRAFASGEPESYPRRLAKAARPQRFGAVFVLTHKGEVALVRREGKGLLGGMLGLPTTAWTDQAPTADEILAAQPARGRWREAGAVDHVFTHFALNLRVFQRGADYPEEAPGALWTPLDRARASVPSLFAKALKRL